MPTPKPRTGLVLGGVFTALVTGLLVFLNFGPAKVEVERTAAWSKEPSVIVCSSAPAWARAEISSVIDELETRGLRFGALRTESFCASTCVYRTKGGETRNLACQEGAIVVDLRDHWFSDAHAGETLTAYDATTGRLQRATVLLPSSIADERPASADLGRPFPRDADRLVLAHELVHGLGYGHTFTRIAGDVVARKTGELMHPELLQSGWGFGGLP